MTKYTPGPWVVNDIRDCGTFIQTEEEFENGCLTIGAVESATNRTYYPTRYEAIANAHLIAAAPDLLEALKAMVDAYRHHDGLGASLEYEPWTKAALDAIFKATGEHHE